MMAILLPSIPWWFFLQAEIDVRDFDHMLTW